MTCTSFSDVPTCYRFFEQFGSLNQRFKERDLLVLESDHENLDTVTEMCDIVSAGAAVSATTPGVTWDNVAYKNIFKFNHRMERSEVI